MTKFTELKKTIAGVLAFAMAFSPMVATTVSAAGVSGSVSSNTITASDNKAEGWVNKHVAETVVLPTVSSNQLAFKLDPQGLLSVSGNEAKYNDVKAGDIVFTGKVSSDEVSLSSNYNKTNVFYATPLFAH